MGFRVGFRVFRVGFRLLQTPPLKTFSYMRKKHDLYFKNSGDFYGEYSSDIICSSNPIQ